MAGGKTNYTQQKINDYIYGGVALTFGATLYVAWFTALPTNAGGGTEPSTGAYARVAVTRNQTNFPATNSTGLISNNTAINFPQATANLGKALGFGIYDAATAGNLLEWGELLGLGMVSTVDPTTDIFTSTAHGFTDGTQVVLRTSNGANPGGLNETTAYFIRDSTTNTFKLTTSPGGTAIDVTSAGNGTHRIHQDFTRTVNINETVGFAAGTLQVQEG